MSVAADIDGIGDTRSIMMDRVEESLYEFLERESVRWRNVDVEAASSVEAIAGFVRAGGKRLRPKFCISGYLAVGGDPSDDAIISAATALELLHASALIHDDVFDESSMRRGVPTVHENFAARHLAGGWRGDPRRFGESMAILAGDLALVYADVFMAEATPRAIQAWRDLRTELMIGQHLDVVAAARFTSDSRLSRTIAQLKSGNYTVHRPLLIGAMVAGRPDVAQPFETYGLAVGEAFQLRDDLLDAFGDTAALGKPARLDADRNKMTFMLSLALEQDSVAHTATSGGSDTLAGSAMAIEVERHIDRLVLAGDRAVTNTDLKPGWRDELGAMAREVAYRDR